MRTLLIATELAACALAWWRTRGEPEHRVIARLLSWLALVDCGRMLTAELLAGQSPPYVGLARLVFRLDQGLFLSWPAAIVAATMLAFLGLRPWLPMVAGAATWLALAAAYPTLHGASMIAAYRAVYLVGTMATVSGIIVGLGGGRVARPARRHLVLMLIVGGDFLIWATAWVSAGHPDWQFATSANVFTFAAVAAAHLPSRWADATIEP